MDERRPLDPGPEMDRAISNIVYDLVPDDLRDPLHYSTDIVSAFIAAARMVEKGYDFAIQSKRNNPERNYTYQADFQNTHSIVSGFAPTAPEALCRAILAIGRNTLPTAPENLAPRAEGPVTP